MKQLGWKVVMRSIKGDFQSYVAIEKWRRYYAVGRRTKGYKETPVLAFRTRNAARVFKGSGDGHIFRAELENPRQQERVSSSFEQNFSMFWHGRRWSPTFPAPEGTVACDAITLLEPAR